MKKDLIIFIAHIDDCECSAYAYLFKHHEEYDTIKIVTASTWYKKIDAWKKNLDRLPEVIKDKIVDINLGFKQRTLFKNLDDVKDKFYQHVDFQKRFDLLTHDQNDSHTDHVAIALIARGLFKYCNRYIAMFSPSSIQFESNYYIGVDEDLYAIKKQAIDSYSIDNEQSYSKLGYYLQSEEHYNIGRSHVLENFVFDDYKSYEIYRIMKWL